jgi:hypothetical protein
MGKGRVSRQVDFDDEEQGKTCIAIYVNNEISLTVTLELRQCHGGVHCRATVLRHS